MSVYVLVNISNNKITFIEFACFGDVFCSICCAAEVEERPHNAVQYFTRVLDLSLYLGSSSIHPCVRSVSVPRVVRTKSQQDDIRFGLKKLPFVLTGFGLS